MRFAFAGCDRNLALFEAVQHAGWQPVKIFTVFHDEKSTHSNGLLTLARHTSIPLQYTPIQRQDFIDLKEDGCDALIVGSYDFKIPPWQEYLRYAINFHPSPLPTGRGPYPLVNAILHQHRHWAVSCHRIDAGYDTGAILAHETFTLDKFESHESLQIKVQMAAARLATKVTSDFVALWDDAKIQPEGDYWPLFSVEDRTIDFAETVHRIRLQLRAFCRLECVAMLSHRPVRIRQGYAWQESHNEPIGTIVHDYAGQIVVACKDGFVVFSDWYFSPT